MEALRRIWIQQFYRDQDSIHLREHKGLDRPVGTAATLSPYDLDARFRVKRSMGWTGYTVQISEASSDHLPHLITYVAIGPATEADVDTPDRVHQVLGRRACCPASTTPTAPTSPPRRSSKAHA
ncbi:hypothetical protein [Streptomyces sp. NPDC048489]|uniref:hypothetical protein n=1 Tax=Streptomyces sp. NPDC048489 TaxID=3154504 RepID=UPI003417FCC2